MKRCLLAVHLLVALAVATGCREKSIPYKPPPPEDAPAQPIDAAPPPVDAAPQAAAPKPTKVVVGDHVSCAVMSDATARCWGKNSQGQLGNGTTVDSSKPVKLALRGVTDVVVGTAHGCALLDDSSVTCWGLINFGKSEPLLVPTAVPGLASAKRIFAVGTAACATLATGPLVCWGDVDTKGRPRLSVGAPEHRAPTPVPRIKNAIAVVTNGALTENNTMLPFGEDIGIPNILEIGTSGDGLCGLRVDGIVECVGTRHCPLPKKGMKPKASEELKLPQAKRLSFDVGICVITKTGRLQCLDSSDGCRADAPWPTLADVENVSGFCARARGGKISCWSVDAKSRVIAHIAGVAGTTAIAGSASHVCLLRTGEIICLGSNKFGALGRGEVGGDLHLDATTVVF